MGVCGSPPSPSWSRSRSGCALNYARFAPIDDAFISFPSRYAQNLAAGNGLVFNVGERVEGYTNFLWVILLAPAEWIGIGAEPRRRPWGRCSRFSPCSPRPA